MNQQHPSHQAGNNPPSGGNPNQSERANAGQTAVSVQITVSGPLAEPFPDYLIFSILNIIALFPVLGLTAIFFSVETRSDNKTGNRLLAEINSRKARFFSIVALGIGTISFLVYSLIRALLK
ncbi:hypothetical protein AOLI_G00255780 [Acnodon oligacanthus]